MKEKEDSVKIKIKIVKKRRMKFIVKKMKSMSQWCMRRPKSNLAKTAVMMKMKCLSKMKMRKKLSILKMNPSDKF